jgi:hypothetical protein
MLGSKAGPGRKVQESETMEAEELPGLEGEQEQGQLSLLSALSFESEKQRVLQKVLLLSPFFLRSM